MSFWNGNAINVYNRLTDWLRYRTSGNTVSDLALDYLIRAELDLWMYRPWSFLKRTTTLTLSSNDATLDSAVGRIHRVYLDDDDDGLPEEDFYLDDPTETRRYIIESTFDRTTGYSHVIKFAMTPSGTPILEYITDFDDLTSDNYSTALLMFPENLTMLAAQRQRLLDIGARNKSDAEIMKAYERECMKFAAQVEGNNTASRITPRDAYGREVNLHYTTMNGQSSHSPTVYGRPNDYHRL